MASLPIVLLSVLFFVTVVSSRSLTIGTTLNAQITFVEDVKLSAIPFKTRTKNVFYTGDKMIKGIAALDNDNSKAQVILTAGGINSTFVNVRLKSERGDGLNYQVQVFV